MIKKKYKFFAVSDIHGDFDALIEGLKNAGFDENNENHILISVGDAFDRGEKSLEVYKYLKHLTNIGKAIVLKGNHTKFLIDYLDGSSTDSFNYYENGTGKTITSFLNYIYVGVPFSQYIQLAREYINKEYPELLQWLKDRPYYFETENYIFTHGGIDTEVKDWHHPHCEKYNFTSWEALTWDDGSFFGKEINNTNKTIVIGHFGTSHLRKLYKIDDGQDEDSILKREDGRVIALDSTTILSHKVNVLVLEDKFEDGIVNKNEVNGFNDTLRDFIAGLQYWFIDENSNPRMIFYDSRNERHRRIIKGKTFRTFEEANEYNIKVNGVKGKESKGGVENDNS